MTFSVVGSPLELDACAKKRGPFFLLASDSSAIHCHVFQSCKKMGENVANGMG